MAGRARHDATTTGLRWLNRTFGLRPGWLLWLGSAISSYDIGNGSGPKAVVSELIAHLAGACPPSTLSTVSELVPGLGRALADSVRRRCIGR